MERKTEEVRRKREVWKIVNKERRRKRINKGTRWKELKKHFMRLLREWRIEW